MSGLAKLSDLMNGGEMGSDVRVVEWEEFWGKITEPFAANANATSKVNVLHHDCCFLDVGGAQLCVLKQIGEVFYIEIVVFSGICFIMSSYFCA